MPTMQDQAISPQAVSNARKDVKGRIALRMLSRLGDSLWWPLLLSAAVLTTAFGIEMGHPQWAFNLTYFSLAIALFVLERQRPHLHEWLKSDHQEWADLGHTALTKSAVQLLVISLGFLGITSSVGGPAGTGWWPNHWPMFAQVGLGLLIAEFGLYWGHRLAHEWSWLWRFHAVHHSARKLWFFNTGRFHFIDTLKSLLLSGVLLALAGAPNTVVIWIGSITAYIGFLTHCNIRMHNPWISYVFNTPRLHRWHHSMDLKEGNKNYGENLMLWDVVFGTFFDDQSRPPPREIGIRDAMPRGFAGQMLAPFRWHHYQQNYRQGKVPAGECL